MSSPGKENINIKGVLERIVFYNEDNGYCIGEMREEKQNRMIIITGTLMGIKCGETLCLSGNWTSHPRHGEQFQVTQFQATLPATVYGIRKYLGSGLIPGVGKNFADKIVDHFGAETLKIISEYSSRLTEIPGVGKKRVQAIKKSWHEQQTFREIIIFLQTYGVSTAQCIHLAKKYGDQAQDILKNEPYRVAREVRGIGFKTADKIAINLGLSNESSQRLDAGILFALEKLEGEGHTAYPQKKLQTYAAKLLNTSETKISQRLSVLLEKGDLLPCVGKESVQLPQHFATEEDSVRSILESNAHSSCLPSIDIEKAIVWAHQKAGFAFAVKQKEAVRTCLEKKVTIITGGPGTGKTTILRALVDILKVKKVKVLLASPTGRAAQRMTEATGAATQTIHRLLKFDPVGGYFVHCEKNPLKCGCLIIDEAGMLDNVLASALFQAIPREAHLILVGDVNQLPSVGPGNILYDLICSGKVAVCELDQIFRQDHQSEIITAAHGILKGSTLSGNDIIDDLDHIQSERDLHFIRAAETDHCVAITTELCQRYLPQHYNLDPIMDLQMLVPMHRGSAGIKVFNERLQRILNPKNNHLKANGIFFQVDDKVIQTRNNYEKNIFNGDMGQITSMNTQEGSLTVRFNDTLVTYESNELGDLQQAYAISIHKSQGSEFPIIIIPLLKQHFMMLRRNLIYTAITRGKQKVFIVGDPAAYAQAVYNQDSKERFTDFQAKLMNES